MHEKALLGPIEPLSCFEAAAVQQAFRHVQRASRIGKVIVRMPQEHDEPIDVSGCPRDVAFDPGAAYLLVGGSTGLGASIATWLVERGARKLAFLSRGYDANMESDSLYAELRAMGCLVSITRGSVENVEDVQTAVESCEVPIKGVFHLAMVLKVSDLPFLAEHGRQAHRFLLPTSTNITRSGRTNSGHDMDAVEGSRRRQSQRGLESSPCTHR